MQQVLAKPLLSLSLSASLSSHLLALLSLSLLRFLIQSHSFSLRTLCCGRGGVLCSGKRFCFCLCPLPLLPLLPLGLTPPCVDPNMPPRVDSKRLRVYRQQVHMFYTCGPVAGTHGDVLNRHTEACWDLHAGFSTFFQRAAPHTPHTPHTNTIQHNTTHNITRRQRESERETETEDREREREEKMKEER